MEDVYKRCPVFENEHYMLRFVQMEDAKDLLKVYGDAEAVKLCNADNCGGDDFHYTTLQRMKQAIAFWKREYEAQGFVRWSLLDKRTNEVIGTMEMFHRIATDAYACGILRLDLRRDYEKAAIITELLTMVLDAFYDLFACDKIATKAIPSASERRKALQALGFSLSDEVLLGHHQERYDSYFTRDK